MPSVHLHYWAGARAVAGTASEEFEAPSVRQALALAAADRDARFSRVVAACSLLVDGLAAHDADLDALLTAPVRVEVLPPFAGGAPRFPPTAGIAEDQGGPRGAIHAHSSTMWTGISVPGTRDRQGGTGVVA